MKRILITGGTGFFGKSILDYFARHIGDYSFTLLSRHGLPSGFLTQIKQSQISNQTISNLKSNNLEIKQLFGDIRTFDIGEACYDAVIHAATPARADVPDGEMRSIIIEGTAHALEQAKRCGASKFMMVSSGGVYGSGFTRPISESDVPHPCTVYGKAKLEAECLAVNSGLYTLIPRCFAFVGKHLDRNAHFAIGNFMRDALAGNDIIINGDGSPMRSYMYADDLVEWLFAILDRGVSGRPYNVGAPVAISIQDVARLVRDTILSDNQTISSQAVPAVRVLGKSVAGASEYYVPNVRRAKRELGLKMRFELIEAIRFSV